MQCGYIKVFPPKWESLRGGLYTPLTGGWGIYTQYLAYGSAASFCKTSILHSHKILSKYSTLLVWDMGGFFSK